MKWVLALPEEGASDFWEYSLDTAKMSPAIQARANITDIIRVFLFITGTVAYWATNM